MRASSRRVAVADEAQWASVSHACVCARASSSPPCPERSICSRTVRRIFRPYQPRCTPHTDYWPVCHTPPLKRRDLRRDIPARSMDRLPMTHSETPLPHRPGTELTARERKDRSAEYVFVLLYPRWLLRTNCTDCVSQASPSCTLTRICVLSHPREARSSKLRSPNLDWFPFLGLLLLLCLVSGLSPTSLDVTMQRCQCACGASAGRSLTVEICPGSLSPPN